MQIIKIAALLEELKFITGQFAIFGCSRPLQQKLIYRYNQLYAQFRQQSKAESGDFFETVSDNCSLDELLILLTLLQNYLQKCRVGK